MEYIFSFFVLILKTDKNRILFLQDMYDRNIIATLSTATQNLFKPFQCTILITIYSYPSQLLVSKIREFFKDEIRLLLPNTPIYIPQTTSIFNLMKCTI